MPMPSKTHYGTFTVTLGDTEYQLKPTLDAVRKIEQNYGGLRRALDALAGLSVDAATLVIAAGADLNPKQTRELAEDVFAAGVADVSAQVVPYVVALLNPADSKQDPDEGNATKKAQ